MNDFHWDRSFKEAMAKELDLPKNVFKFAAGRADVWKQIQLNEELADLTEKAHELALASIPHEVRDGRSGFVYFIEGGGLVKIGHSTAPAKRFHDIQVTSPVLLQLLAVLPGSMDTERLLHRHFSELRERNEWFRVDEWLLRFILAVTRRYGTWEEQLERAGL